MVAPEINNMIFAMEGGKFTFNEKTTELVDEIFTEIDKIAPCDDDNKREIWLKADRGTIEDFGNYEDYLDNGTVENYEEFAEWWETLYTEEVYWFPMTTIEHDSYRAIFLGRKLIYQSEIFELDKIDSKVNASDFFAWMLDAVKSVITGLQDDSYNDDVAENLSLSERTGVILRKDYWNIFPEYKEDYFSCISQAEVDDFLSLIADQADADPVGEYIPQMTSGMFYDFCKLGYQANGYEKADELSAKELYYKYADGRDEGLSKINENSVDEFESWYFDKTRFGGHPWEVCAGGNSTHISLFIFHCNQGYYLTLAGKSYSRSIETVKFYIALRKTRIPVSLCDAKGIAERLMETDFIGIVPERVFPSYCEGLFPGYNIMDFIHLPDVKTDECLAKLEWLPEKIVYLKNDGKAGD